MKKKTTLKPVGGSSENKIASALTVIAVILFVIYGIFILSCLALPMDSTLGVFAGLTVVIQYGLPGIVLGIACLGAAKIIELLQLKVTQEYEVVFVEEQETEKKEKSAAHTAPAPASAPTRAASVDETGKQAHFSARPEERLFCPVCGKEQSSKRSACQNCGAKFVFDNETTGE